MRRTFLAQFFALALCLGSMSAPHAQTARSHPFQYIVDTTKAMNDLLAKPSVTADEFLVVTRMICKNLDLLMDDQKFYDALTLVVRASNASRNERARLDLKDQASESFRMFSAIFLRFERELMTAAGLDEKTVDRITTAAEEVLAHAKTDFDPLQLMRVILQFKHHACDAERELKNVVDREKFLAKMRQFAIRSGGVALIVVNAAAVGGALVVPAGFSAATLATGSVSVGVALTIDP